MNLAEMNLREAAPIRSIGDYLSTKSRHLIIPPWQREYVWQTGENGEVGDLLEDLKEFLLSGQEEYWLGPVIVCEEPKGSGNYWLIDGQQRTLTLLIFAMVAKKYMTRHKLLSGSSEIHARILTLLCDSVSDSAGAYLPRVSMDRGKADSILQTIFLWSGQPDDEKTRELLEDRETWTQTQRNLANVAEWIYEAKFEKGWIDEEMFVESIGKIFNSVKLIELHLPNVQTALTVFDRINNRGADLNSADLVKNRIFQYESDEQFSKITEDWREMRSNLGESTLTRLKDPIFLLRALAVIRQGQESVIVEEPLKAGKKITYNELTDFWTVRLDPNKRSTKFENVTSGDLVEQLLDGSKWLSNLSKEKYLRKGEAELQDLYFARYLKIVQHYPILLAGRHLSESVFSALSRQVHCRTAFYFLSGERTQEFENLVPEWAFDIAALDKDADLSSIKKIYSKYSISEKGFTELHQAMSSWSYKDATERRKIRAVLAQLSKVVDKACGKELRNSPEAYFEVARRKSKHGWDIDHIAPKASEPKESIFQTIGNLVLLEPPDNRSRGKRKPSDKSKNYSNSALYLTKTLVGVEASPYKKRIEKFLGDLELRQNFSLNEWDEKQVVARTNFYFKILKSHLHF
jgi:Protein of unknown function DUF262/Protein of unknown function (DUF1524)